MLEDYTRLLILVFSLNKPRIHWISVFSSYPNFPKLYAVSIKLGLILDQRESDSSSDLSCDDTSDQHRGDNPCSHAWTHTHTQKPLTQSVCVVSWIPIKPSLQSQVHNRVILSTCTVVLTVKTIMCRTRSIKCTSATTCSEANPFGPDGILR